MTEMFRFQVEKKNTLDLRSHYQPIRAQESTGNQASIIRKSGYNKY